MQAEQALARLGFRPTTEIPLLRNFVASIRDRAMEGSIANHHVLLSPRGWQSSLSEQTLTECKAAKSVRVAYDILPALTDEHSGSSKIRYLFDRQLLQNGKLFPFRLRIRARKVCRHAQPVAISDLAPCAP